MRRITTQITDYEDDQAEENRVTQSLAGMAVALLLVVASLFLIHTLQATAQVEDCLLAGRANCDAMVTANR